MNLSLTIDQGNSSAKVSVFSGTTLLQSHRFERLAPGDLDFVMAGHAVTAAIYSSVVGNDSQIEELLSAKGCARICSMSVCPCRLPLTMPHPPLWDMTA